MTSGMTRDVMMRTGRTDRSSQASPQSLSGGSQVLRYDFESSPLTFCWLKLRELAVPTAPPWPP